MSSHLRELQEKLQAYLLTGDSAIAKDIVDPTQDKVDTRLAIYRDSYYLLLVNILQKDFPLLEKLLGEEQFEVLALAYINAYPSQYCSIKDFGARLPGFLQTTAPYNKQLHLGELAELIRQLDNTLVAADAPVLTVQDLAIISQDKWGELQLIPHPSVKLLTQHYNTFSLWQALQQDKPLPKVTKSSEPQYCLIWRKELMPYCVILNKEAVCIIKTLQAQRTFAEVCEELAECLPAEEVVQYVVNQLIEWLNQGVFSEIRIL